MRALSDTRTPRSCDPRPRSARLAVWISLAVAVLLLGGIGGFNFTIDSAGVLSDQTSTGNVKEYITALRRAPAGMPYTHYDRPAKLRLATTSTADCLVAGSSHMMTLRVDRNAIIRAECGALDNAGVSGASFEDLILMMGAALTNPKVERVYIGMDIWSMSRNTSERWRKVTANFQAARQAFGLREGLYETRGGASIEQRLRELFSLGYLRLNYRQLKRALRGETALVYSTEPLTEADLRTQLALRPDGSLSYPDEFEPSPSEADLNISDQWIVPPYFDPAVVDEMRQAVQVLQQAGKTVSFVIGPYHPAVFKCGKPRICEGIRVMDPLIRKLGAELGVPVIGGFEPGIFGYTGDSFLDFQHLRGAELHRLRILSPGEVAESLAHVPAATE